MERYAHEEQAKAFCKAIKALAESPANLDNLEAYLSISFAEWLARFCTTPEGITEELECFASMDCED